MKIIIAIVGVVIAIGILWMILGGEEELKKPTAGSNIILFGDSLAEGVGAGPGKDVASQLSEALGQQVINAGVSGDTTEDALLRLESDVLSKNPKVVIIILGGNDALQNKKASIAFTNLENIIDQIQTMGAGVVLVGIRGGLQNSTYKKRFPELAEAKGAAYIPDVLKGVFGNDEFMYDTIHPNGKGYKIFVEKILPEVRKLLE